MSKPSALAGGGIGAAALILWLCLGVAALSSGVAHSLHAVTHAGHGHGHGHADEGFACGPGGCQPGASASHCAPEADDDAHPHEDDPSSDDPSGPSPIDDCTTCQLLNGLAWSVGPAPVAVNAAVVTESLSAAVPAAVPTRTLARERSRGPPATDLMAFA
ncbi:MAG: hypothetical protein AB8G96_08455 [Phycisphaerales bacterium]